jgi:Holliday junction resolvasome RuvABC DNA-binding subunit
MTKPIRTDAYPVYMCEKCQSEYSESVDYVNKIGKILCICGEIIKTDPIKSVVLSFGKKSSETQETSQYDIEPYVNGLVNMGWKKSEARKVILDKIRSHGASIEDLDDIIKEVLV